VWFFLTLDFRINGAEAFEVLLDMIIIVFNQKKLIFYRILQ
jgi:hypothetical protein